MDEGPQGTWDTPLSPAQEGTYDGYCLFPTGRP